MKSMHNVKDSNAARIKADNHPEKTGTLCRLPDVMATYSTRRVPLSPLRSSMSMTK